MDPLMWLGTAAGALLAIGALLRRVWRVLRRVEQTYELVTELSPNSGHSIKDAVDRIDSTVAGLAEAQGQLGDRLDGHLAEHARRGLFRRPGAARR